MRDPDLKSRLSYPVRPPLVAGGEPSDASRAERPIRAWKVPIPEGGGHTSVALWLVDVPGAHAFWSEWLISVVHLRPADGVPPAKVIVPDATHEIIIGAIDPGHEADPDKPDALGAAMMTPLDVVQQIAGITDAHAVELAERAVQLILDGKASPDSDFRAAWARILPKLALDIASGR